MNITLSHLVAVSRFAHKFEEIDGPPNEARKQHLRDFLGCFPLTDEHLLYIEKMAEEMSDDKAKFYIKDFDKDSKVILTQLLADIVCTDDQLSEIGREALSKLVLDCNLAIPGAEDQWKEAQVYNFPLSDVPFVPSFLKIRSNGAASRRESDQKDLRALDKQISEWIDAERTEVVRFTAPLNEISKRLRLKGCHVVFLVNANGADDNMAGTILYGGRTEILGDILVALETDEDYKLEGFRNDILLTDTYYAIDDTVGGLLHYQ